ncbi:MAG: hypothetical protein MJ200_04825 [Mycoplasmoidaceae bacterium]|nr:hypothetical protein [Mycoplasmoidaceae bacterium]
MGLKITDIDFDVLFYSTDGTIFNHVSQAELDDGLYYCKDNMICAQTFTNVGANTKFQVLVKFNNHNGENINVYWSNRPL